MSLFRNEPFVSAAGRSLGWKIECDALTDDDWKCVAAIVGLRMRFERVHGVPSGGRPFAEALRPYCTPNTRRLLIVDDVFTTGKSITQFMNELTEDWRPPYDWKVQGLVLFARAPTPAWVEAVWQLGFALHDD